MKVIREGEKFTPFDHGCKNCGAQLRIESVQDLVRDRGGDQRDSWDNLKFQCPCCRRYTVISDKLVPDHLRDQIGNGGSASYNDR